MCIVRFTTSEAPQQTPCCGAVFMYGPALCLYVVVAGRPWLAVRWRKDKSAAEFQLLGVNLPRKHHHFQE